MGTKGNPIIFVHPHFYTLLHATVLWEGDASSEDSFLHIATRMLTLHASSEDGFLHRNYKIDIAIQ